MRYHVLACDYDGTLATDGQVDDSTLAALDRLRASGRKLILVTGRELPDLMEVFPRLDLFDRVVAENGALLFCPSDRTERVLAEPPPPEFAATLRQRDVAPLATGRVIVATWEPQEKAVLETIRELGLELQVIFNKGAVMVLPSGVNKATGLDAALAELRISPPQHRRRRRRRERPCLPGPLRAGGGGGQRAAAAQGAGRSRHDGRRAATASSS